MNIHIILFTDYPTLDVPDTIPDEVKKLINKTKRKRDELDLELKKLGNKKLKEASKKLEREYVIMEGSLTQSSTDAQSHNKKLQTENDELKCQIDELKKAMKLKDKIKQKKRHL